MQFPVGRRQIHENGCGFESSWTAVLPMCVHCHVRHSFSPRVRLSVSPRVRLPVSPRVRLSVCPSHPVSVCPSHPVSVCPSHPVSVCPSVRLTPCPSVCLSHPVSVCLSVSPRVCLSVCLTPCPSVCLSVSPRVRLSVCPSHPVSVCLSVRLTPCQSVCPSCPVSVCPSVRLTPCPSVCLFVSPRVRLSGRLILDQLHLTVDVYYASEVDDDALMVTAVRHGERHGDRFRQLGDVTKLLRQQVTSSLIFSDTSIHLISVHFCFKFMYCDNLFKFFFYVSLKFMSCTL